jgi:hypothetical protein
MLLRPGAHELVEKGAPVACHLSRWDGGVGSRSFIPRGAAAIFPQAVLFLPPTSPEVAHFLMSFGTFSFFFRHI